MRFTFVSPCLLFIIASCMLACTSSKTPVLDPNQGGEGLEGNSGREAGLIVSEVVAKSDDELFLGGNDWIEIFNSGTAPVELSDYSLADSSENRVSLPEGTLEPGEYFVIAAVDSEDINPPEPYVAFKLGSDDLVSLFLAFELIDTLAWTDGEAESGSSFGVVGNIAQTIRPTPGVANEVLVIENPSNQSDLIISEVVAKSGDSTFLEGSDWIELYNSGTQVIDLSSYALADSSSDRVVLESVDLAPGEYIVIAAVGSESLNPIAPYVPFKLGTQDSVLLYEGAELVGRLSWSDGDAERGLSYGLVSGEAVSTEPTPNAQNLAVNVPQQGTPTGNSGLFVSEIVAKSDNEAFLEGADWIEIYNSGSVSVDLSQYSLSDNGSQPIALTGLLGAGQYLVIAAVDSEAINPPSPYVPFKLGKEDSVQLFLGAELVRKLAWSDGDASEGYSYALLGGVARSATPTPGQENRL